MLTHLSDVLLKGKSPALFLSFCVRLLFETYWTVAAKASSPAKSSESRKSRQLHIAVCSSSRLKPAVLARRVTSRLGGPYCPAARLPIFFGYIAYEKSKLLL